MSQNPEREVPFCPHNYQLDGVAVILDGKDFFGLSATGFRKSAYIYMTIHVRGLDGIVVLTSHFVSDKLRSEGRKSWVYKCNRRVGHRPRVHETGVTIISTISMLKPPFDNSTCSEGAPTIEKILHDCYHLHFRCKSDLNRHRQSSHGVVGR